MTDPMARARALEEWLEDALFEHDRMCGRSDCQHTARKLLPLLLEREASQRTEVIEACARVAEEWAITGRGKGVANAVASSINIASAIRAQVEREGE